MLKSLDNVCALQSIKEKIRKNELANSTEEEEETMNEIA